ncbi:hypothetical protein [Solirubrum puertoriconensis]|uniref:Uncharacterized protein n=1 Tax=Solirubrum puertoriconensis TaxID=1751427 RepID=A0A9X0L595_SOLP1|nr:hypothetical protein [Solirubrum puertoriconensis]KUG08431.1 hypothetical protein ASU33_09705 [Solirubrum puertoriconensis]
MRFATPLLFLGTSLSLVGCVPQYYVSIKPAGSAARWENGLELVAAQVDSVEADMAVAAMAGNYLEFDVTVRNRSSRAVLVAPEQFYLEASFPPSASPNTPAPTGAVRVPAVNPEDAILKLQ